MNNHIWNLNDLPLNFSIVAWKLQYQLALDKQPTLCSFYIPSLPIFYTQNQMIKKITMLLIEGEQEDWILTEIYGPIETLEQIISLGLFFFFFCLLISLGADHISEMHLILIQYNIANPKNFRTKALLLGWTRSSYWIMTIHHKSIPTSPSAKFQFAYLKSTLQTQKCSLIIYTKVQMLRTKKQVKDLRVSHTPNPPFFPWGKKEHKTR